MKSESIPSPRLPCTLKVYAKELQVLQYFPRILVSMAWWAVRSEQSRYLGLTSFSVWATEQVECDKGPTALVDPIAAGFPRK